MTCLRFLSERDLAPPCNFHIALIWGLSLAKVPFSSEFGTANCASSVSHRSPSKLIRKKNQKKLEENQEKLKNKPLEEILGYNISPEALFFWFYMVL